MSISPISHLALKRTELLFSCYPDQPIQDEDATRVWMQAVGLTLSQYTDQVILRVTDPLRGIPSTSRFRPSVAEVRTECDKWQEVFSHYSPYRKAYEKRVARQLEDRRRWEADPSVRKMREFYESNRLSDYLIECRDKGIRPWENRSLTIGRFER
jgi:hypothetical protein